MTAVVTGASGHLGVNLLRSLLATGTDVRVVVHRNRAPLRGLDVDVVTGDVADRAAMRSAFDGAETVYHLAGVIALGSDRDGRMQRVNAEGAAASAEAALQARVGRFILCSSIHAFDLEAAESPIDEQAARTPAESRRHAAYDRSKAEGERRVRAVIERGLDAVIVHPTSVIGPWDFEPSRMGRVFLGLFEGNLPALVGGAFDFVDVRDVAEGMQAAASRGTAGASYLLSAHRETIRGIAEIAGRITGRRPPRLTVPNRLAAAVAPAIQLVAGVTGSEPIYTRASIGIVHDPPSVSHAKATEELGYAPRPLVETISDTYQWFSSVGRIDWDPDE